MGLTLVSRDECVVSLPIIFQPMGKAARLLSSNGIATVDAIEASLKRKAVLLDVGVAALLQHIWIYRSEMHRPFNEIFTFRFFRAVQHIEPHRGLHLLESMCAVRDRNKPFGIAPIPIPILLALFSSAVDILLPSLVFGEEYPIVFVHEAQRLSPAESPCVFMLKPKSVQGQCRYTLSRLPIDSPAPLPPMPNIHYVAIEKKQGLLSFLRR